MQILDHCNALRLELCCVGAGRQKRNLLDLSDLKPKTQIKKLQGFELSPPYKNIWTHRNIVNIDVCRMICWWEGIVVWFVDGEGASRTWPIYSQKHVVPVWFGSKWEQDVGWNWFKVVQVILNSQTLPGFKVFFCVLCFCFLGMGTPGGWISYWNCWFQ